MTAAHHCRGQAPLALKLHVGGHRVRSNAPSLRRQLLRNAPDRAAARGPSKLLRVQLHSRHRHQELCLRVCLRSERRCHTRGLQDLLHQRGQTVMPLCMDQVHPLDPRLLDRRCLMEHRKHPGHARYRQEFLNFDALSQRHLLYLGIYQCPLAIGSSRAKSSI